MWRTDSLEKTLMLGEDWRQEEKGETGWDGWMASLIRWTWVWAGSGSWWWTGGPGVLQSMQSQRVGHDWGTEPNWWNASLCVLVLHTHTNTHTHVRVCVYIYDMYTYICTCVVYSCTQSYLTLWDPMDCSLPGFSVFGIFQAKILEWVVMPSSRGSSQPRDWTCNSCASCIGRWFLYH